MFDINNFRIAYEPLTGYCIEQEHFLPIKPEVNSMRAFLGYKPLKNDPVKVWRWFHTASMKEDPETGLIGCFKTKEEAVKFLKDLCTPTTYFYPPNFK